MYVEKEKNPGRHRELSGNASARLSLSEEEIMELLDNRM